MAEGSVLKGGGQPLERARSESRAARERLPCAPKKDGVEHEHRAIRGLPLILRTHDRVGGHKRDPEAAEPHLDLV
jgi:hypothetical protein